MPPLRGPTRQTTARKRKSGRFGRDDNLGLREEQGALGDIVFHGGGKTGKVLAGGGALDLDAELLFVFGAGFAQDGDGAECFVIDAGDKIGFAGTVPLPKLANLNLSRAHSAALNVERPAGSVNSPCGWQYTVPWHYRGGNGGGNHIVPGHILESERGQVSQGCILA